VQEAWLQKKKKKKDIMEVVPPTWQAVLSLVVPFSCRTFSGVDACCLNRSM
jgi:hypothetical protein